MPEVWPESGQENDGILQHAARIPKKKKKTVIKTASRDVQYHDTTGAIEPS